MVPIYEQIVNQIRNQIVNHELKENDSLPSVRSLAHQLKISALTVKKAYDYLEEEGFIQTIQNLQGIVVSSPEEIAYRYRMINKEQLLAAAEKYGKSPYGRHLRAVADGKMPR